MNYDNALPIAQKLLDLLAPACKRIQIAGSLRRLKPDPGDIEIVAVPDLRPFSRFGFRDCSTLLDAILLGLERGDDEHIRLHRCQGGGKMKQYFVSTDGGQTWCIKLDLFLVTPPADWGVLYLIRTGPAEFSHWIVTPKFIGGGLPNGYRVSDGRVISEAGDHMPCPDEIDFLSFCGLDWIEPKDRRPLWQRSVRKIQVSQLAKS